MNAGFNQITLAKNSRERTVVVLGASPNVARYSNQAVQLLKLQGYLVIPVHPSAREIKHIQVVRDLHEINRPVGTLSMYVCQQNSYPLIDAIIRLKPLRVIFNPGSESPELEQHLVENQISYIHGCTLVMLKMGIF